MSFAVLIAAKINRDDYLIRYVNKLSIFKQQQPEASRNETK